MSEVQDLLIHETKEEYEYDRQLALTTWRILQSLIPKREDRGYTEYESMTDDDRIIYCFELLDGSIFGDIIFPSLANFSQGSELIQRNWDE